MCYTILATGKDNPYDNLPDGWGEHPPKDGVPGEYVVETPIGREEEALHDPSIRRKIKELQKAGKKVHTSTQKGKIILVVGASALVLGAIAVEERLRRKRKGIK